MKTLSKILLNAALILGISYLPMGIHVENFWIAVIVAVVIGILNTIVKPILVLLTIPVTILTLGLFLLVINALIVMLADFIVPGFHVDSFMWAFVFGVILSIVNWFFNKESKKEKK